MTGGQVILVCVIACIAVGITALAWSVEGSWKHALIAFAICGTITAAFIIAFVWFNNNTASGLRRMKDWRSERENGIEREITITAEDGRRIFYYKGKVDVELDHSDNYIKFEAEDGRRFIVVYGIQDTVEIIEVNDDG